jgi:two-component system, NtrC family, response regulator AtoC
MTSLTLLQGNDDLLAVGLLGAHPCMLELYEGIRRAARIDAPVVVSGPTGSGKELVARAIHRLSPVAEGPFCAVNVAALPEGVIESELFGTVRGAFTGAVAHRPGLVETAEGGILFLDEAGDLPLAVQPKLLRMLEYGEVRRVGATKVTLVRFRTLVAVQDDPTELRCSGRWRDDFYYRVTSVVLRVPSLRDRRSDIPAIAVAFLLSRKLPGMTKAGLEMLQDHQWPGNVRELQQTLVRAAFYADGETIVLEQVQRALMAGIVNGVARERGTLAAARSRHVQEVVAGCAGDTRKAAELLGISRRHLYRLMNS